SASVWLFLSFGSSDCGIHQLLAARAHFRKTGLALPPRLNLFIIYLPRPSAIDEVSMRRALFAASFVLVPTLAFAHAGPAGHTHDLVSGFAHPIGGLDHLLAMVAVGMLAAQLGGRALWLVPASFVAMMAAAGFAGMAGVHLPLAEAGIVLSIILLGAVVALRLTMPVAAAMALVAFFAIFHGYAHGLETPETASGLLYGLGFLA